MQKVKGNGLLLITVLLTVLLGAAGRSLAYPVGSLWLHTARWESDKAEKRTFHLCFGNFPYDNGLDNGRIWLKSPDGGIKEVVLTSGSGHQPNADIETKYAGLYTALAFYEYESGSPQGLMLVRCYAKYQFHHSDGLKVREEKAGKFPVDAPLEIIPLTPIPTPGLREGDEFSLQVLYRGKPLVNVPLSVTTEEGWARCFCTDNDGKLAARLIKDKASQPDDGQMPERYLFRVDYEKPSAGSYLEKSYKGIHHLATYSLDVYPSDTPSLFSFFSRRWQGKGLGYFSGMAAVLVAGGVAALKRVQRLSIFIQYGFFMELFAGLRKFIRT